MATERRRKRLPCQNMRRVIASFTMHGHGLAPRTPAAPRHVLMLVAAASPSMETQSSLETDRAQQQATSFSMVAGFASLGSRTTWCSTALCSRSTSSRPRDYLVWPWCATSTSKRPTEPTRSLRTQAISMKAQNRIMRCSRQAHGQAAAPPRAAMRTRPTRTSSLARTRSLPQRPSPACWACPEESMASQCKWRSSMQSCAAKTGPSTKPRKRSSPQRSAKVLHPPSRRGRSPKEHSLLLRTCAVLS
eukprot:Amastigsp_a343_365.p2 type:complete len:247 gc:universal Amastigsp_a343_365:1889-1149(-)